jgi:hypothetical protein
MQLQNAVPQCGQSIFQVARVLGPALSLQSKISLLEEELLQKGSRGNRSSDV